jgi:hypothetical protein
MAQAEKCAFKGTVLCVSAPGGEDLPVHARRIDYDYDNDDETNQSGKRINGQ